MSVRSTSQTLTSSTEPAAIRILWSDEFVVAALKPSGLPVQPDPTGDPDLLSLLRDQLREPALQLVHRLDRPVSGVVLFGRTPQATEGLNHQFRQRSVRKVYRAIVEGRVDEPGELHGVLRHDPRRRRSNVSTDPDRGTAGMLRVRPLHLGERYTLLEVEPDGGAFHQIRAQLSAAGWPIKGDVKYGARRGEKDRSIHLHACAITFVHPVTGVSMTVDAPLPVSGSWQVLARTGGSGQNDRGLAM